MNKFALVDLGTLSADTLQPLVNQEDQIAGEGDLP
jgi:hypothetical protein